MHYDPDHEPDPGTEEADAALERTVRDGTDAVVVGEVDDVQVRAVSATGSTPEGLKLSIVDPGADVVAEEQPAIDPDAAELSSSTVDATADTTGETTGASARLAAKKGVPQPKIFSRAQWGADEQLRDKGSLRYGEIHAGFVHHTVNANEYSKDEVPSILRGIYAYHTQSRGWSDVGYNFLVDRFGRIWEGRYGGVDRPVVGAHTLGYNDDAFAMSAIGNFETARPSQAMIDAYAALMAWKLSLHGIAADDTKQFVSSRNFHAINGHRDAGSTACPGRYLYEQLPQIRARAAKIQRSPNTPVTPPVTPPAEPVPPTPSVPARDRVLKANLSGAQWPDLIVRDKASKHAMIVRTAGQVAFVDPVVAAPNWRGKDLVVAAGDLDGDGRGDLIARAASTKVSTLYLGAGDGALTRATTAIRKFAGMDQLTGVGDFDGDGRNDVVGRDAATDRLWLHPGNGRGGFRPARLLAADWSAYDLTAGVNDFNDDGRADLVARSGNTLYLVPRTARGLGSRVALPGGWARFDLVTGRGDATGDKIPDVVARVRSTGKTYIYPGDGSGGLSARVGGWTRYDDVRWLALAGQLAGSKKLDLAGLEEGGALKVFENSGRRNVASVVDTGTVLDDIDLLLNVGDWNGDGRGDVMTRDRSTGVLHFRAGVAKNRLAAPVVAGNGWQNRTLVAPAGDLTGDGLPDLVARGGAGKDRIFPSNGKSGFGASRATKHSGDAVGRVGLSMWDGDDTPDTAVRRGDGTLWTWSTETGTSTQLLSGLKRYDWLLGLGDVDGDGRGDVVARVASTGTLWLIPGRAGTLGPRRLIAGGFDAYDYAG
jgi:hypothetical protein